MSEERYEENLHLGATRGVFENARALRRKETPAEKTLWLYLRDRRLGGKKFRRQHPVDTYILDFYCHECRLAIELDGEIHAEKMNKQYDEARTERLNDFGIKVIRFTNSEIESEVERVLDVILKNLV